MVYRLSPPMQFLKDLWDDYRARRQKRKAGKNKENENRASDATPTSGSQRRHTAPASPARERSFVGEAQTHMESERNVNAGSREILETNPEYIDRPTE